MTQVVIDDIIPRTQLTAAASQTVFNTNWTADATTDILVYARASGIPPNDATQLVSSSNYTVTLIGASQTVRVTFLSGRTANDIITIVRNTPAERLNLYINTNFVPSMLNEDFGILTLVDQQAQMYDTTVAPRYNVSAVIDPQTTGGGGDVVLPILPAGYGWRKNDANTAIEPFAIPSGGFAPAAAKYVLQQTNSFLPNSFSLGTLSDGLLKQTVAAGIATPAIAVLDSDYYGPGMVGYMQYPAGVKDSSGNIITRNLSTPSSVNYITFTNNVAGQGPIIGVEGTDPNIQLTLKSKGISPITLATQAASNAFIIYNGTAYQHETIFSFANTANVVNIGFQDASGTVAFLSDVLGTVTSAQGTQNQVLVNGTFGTQETGDIIFTLPQDIASTSTPQFNQIKLNGSILDNDGNFLLGLVSSGASAVNYLAAFSNNTGLPVILTSYSTIDPDVALHLACRGAGKMQFFTTASTNAFIFNSGTANQHITNWIFPNTSATRNVTWQDASGTLAFLSDIPAGSPSALTKTDDTNVTLTLGGTPATALLQATSLTLGWTGQLGLTRGGSNASLTASNGGIVYSTATAMAILAGTATANLPLLSGSTAAPTWGAFALSLGGVLTTAGAHTLSGAFASTFTFTNTTSVTFPTAGTLATTSQIPTGAALTKTDDTNVTLTLGGSPTTALINAASLTLGWTGQLGLTRGGSNASLTASNGGIVYSTATAMAILAGTATATQMLQSGASGAPTWSTTIWPATSTINQLLYSSAANTIAGLATANNGILVTSAGGVPSIGNTVGAGLTMPSITFNSTSGIIGTTTNDSAAALSVGQIVSSVVIESTVSLTVNTPANVTSISLTAGDWDVWGNVVFAGAGATVVIYNVGWISATSATLPASNLWASKTYGGGGLAIYTALQDAFCVPSQRISLSATTTIYLSVQAGFINSTSTAGGGIYARRRR